jgi:hypothetical protein
MYLEVYYYKVSEMLLINKSPARTCQSEQGHNPTQIAPRVAVAKSVARQPWAVEGHDNERVAV